MGLFTIGHTHHTHEEFLKLLRMHDINYILDVRSTPYSKFAEQFNREIIEKFLRRNGVAYNFMGKYFGARQTDTSLYTTEGYLDFEKTIGTEQFQMGVRNVILGLNKGNNIALMCTEKDPFDCHRAIMVARAFSLQGIEVNHILADGQIESHASIDEMLLDKYFPDRFQISLFEEEISDEERLRRAYQKRNKDIGYHIQKEE